MVFRLVALAVVMTCTLTQAQDKLKVEPKFKANEAFYQQVTTDVEQVVKVTGGADLKLKHSQTFMFKWLPIKQDGKTWQVELTIEGVKLKVDIATNPVTYDSTVEQPSGGNNPSLAEFFKNLIGSKFTVTFGEAMTVTKVEGRSEFLKKLGGANPQIEQLLQKILSDESLKEMSDPTAGLMPTPNAEKAVNDSWEKKSTLPLGPIGSYDRTLKFTYKGKDPAAKELDLIEVNTTLVYKAPPPETDGLLFRIKGGTLETTDPKAGTYQYDAANGWVTKANLTVKMKGNLTVTIGTTETQVELYQDQTTTIETKKESFVPVKAQPPESK